MEHRPITPDPRGNPAPNGRTGLASPEIEAIATHWRLILAAVLVFAAAAAGFVLLRTPLYQGKAQLLVETGALEFLRDEPVIVTAPIVAGLMETQVRLIASRGIAEQVVDRMALTADPEFVPRPGIARRLAGALGLAPALPDGGNPAARRAQAVASFAARARITALGLSNVVEIGFASRSPEKAATVANELARAYQRTLDLAAGDRARGASAWVQERVRSAGTRATIISEATPPVVATGPRGAVVVAAAALLGLLVGLALAIGRYLVDPTARGTEQLATLIGAAALGQLPYVRLRPDGSGAVEAIVPARPASPYARALLHVEAALQERRRDRSMILGVAAATAGEGATAVAANLAGLLALHGYQVMLIDGNAANPAITRRHGLIGTPGLGEVLSGAACDEIPAAGDERSGLDILPIGDAAGSAGAPFHCAATADLAARLRASYELVIVDLPPVMDSASVRAAAGFLDGLVLVLDAAPKSHRAIRCILERTGRSRDKLLGFVVNRTAPAAFGLPRATPPLRVKDPLRTAAE